MSKNGSPDRLSHYSWLTFSLLLVLLSLLLLFFHLLLFPITGPKFVGDMKKTKHLQFFFLSHSLSLSLCFSLNRVKPVSPSYRRHLIPKRHSSLCFGLTLTLGASSSPSKLFSEKKKNYAFDYALFVSRNVVPEPCEGNFVTILLREA